MCSIPLWRLSTPTRQFLSKLLVYKVERGQLSLAYTLHIKVLVWVRGWVSCRQLWEVWGLCEGFSRRWYIYKLGLIALFLNWATLGMQCSPHSSFYILFFCSINIFMPLDNFFFSCLYALCLRDSMLPVQQLWFSLRHNGPMASIAWFSTTTIVALRSVLKFSLVAKGHSQ